MYLQANTETCPEIDPQMESEFEVEARKIPGRCCPEIVKTACRNDGKLYKPGETWKSLTDSCIIETCVDGPNITKRKEVEVCSKQCAQVRTLYHMHLHLNVFIHLRYFINTILIFKGWSYQEPEDGKCCGECKQAFCIFEDILYAPGMTWSSDDNCTTFTCMKTDEQASYFVRINISGLDHMQLTQNL